MSDPIMKHLQRWPNRSTQQHQQRVPNSVPR